MSASHDVRRQAPRRLDWKASPAFTRRLRLAALPASGLLIGLGLSGALIDGLLLQELLGWHPLSTDPETERRAASLFYVTTLAILLIGLDLLFRLRPATRRARRREIAAWILLGAGLFALLVGLGDHHLAAARHVRPDAANVLLWDLAYLAVGLGLTATGAALLWRDGALSFRGRRGRWSE